MLKKLMFFSVVLLGLSVSAYAAGNETVDSRLEVVSTTPVVESITLDDLDDVTGNSIDLTPNATERLNCYGYVNDTDGFGDLRELNATIYASGIGTQAHGVADDNLTHYTNTSCDLSSLNVDGFFNCSFNMWFYATNTTWTCSVNVTDFAYNLNSTGLNDTTPVEDLVAINIDDATVDFGPRSLNTNSSADTNVSVWNEGNVALDLDVDAYEANATIDGTEFDSSYAFNCSTGQIDVGNLRFNNTYNADYDTSLSMSQTGFSRFSGFDMAHTTAGINPTRQLTHWAIGLPETGIAGLCTGRIIYVALASGG
ncbi:MAG: hypothetical protein ACOC32_00925 [Nanoarchaeota archaeon]